VYSRVSLEFGVHMTNLQLKIATTCPFEDQSMRSLSVKEYLHY
jgi:hypothetical protein